MKSKKKLGPQMPYGVGEQLNRDGLTIVGSARDGVPIATVTARPALDFSSHYAESRPGDHREYRGKTGLGIVAPRYDGDRVFG
jgi:hypothetical protein